MTLLSLASWFSCSFQRLLLSVAILALLNAAAAAQEPAESPEVQAAVVQPVINDGVAVGSERTDSPRLTISTFLQLRAQLEGAVAAYKQERDS